MRIGGTTVCITGAAGFLGRHLAIKLLERGAKVIALDNFSIGAQDSLAGIYGDLEIRGTSETQKPSKNPLARQMWYTT